MFSPPLSSRSRSQWSSVAWRLLWGPFILWASSWLWPNSVIAAPAATPRVTVVSSSTRLVSVTVFMWWGRKLYDQTPTLRTRCGITVCLVSTLWPFRHGWPYQECKTPADIALGVMGTRKLPYHDKVVTPFGAETLEFWPYLYKHWNSGPVLINIGILILFFHYKHWNSGPIFKNIGILILSFQTLEFLAPFYKRWNSDLILSNTSILALFLYTLAFWSYRSKLWCSGPIFSSFQT